MSQKTQIIVFKEPGKAELEDIEIPPCGDDEVTAETIYSFVSPGTELRIFSGKKEAEGKFPIIPGYSWVGKVVEIGKNVRGWDKGMLVTGRNPIKMEGYTSLWGGQASHHNCSVSGYDALLKLPDGANAWDYTPVEVAAISWRGTTIACPGTGDVAVVIGQGMVGFLAAKWLLHHGASVIVCDINEQRLAKASQIGALAAVNASLADCPERILSFCPGGADIVVEASSSLKGVKLANSLLRQSVTRRLDMSYTPLTIRNNAAFWPRLVYLATYIDDCYMLPPVEGVTVLKPADRTVQDRLCVIDKIKRGFLNADEMLEKPVSVEDAPEAYIRLRDCPGEHNSLVFQWK